MGTTLKDCMRYLHGANGELPNYNFAPLRW